MERDLVVPDIGGGSWRAGPYNTWVSKSDVIQYAKCPYKVYLSHQQGIPYSDFMISAAKAALLEPGTRFEAGILENIPIEEVADLDSARTEEVLIRPLELLRNYDLGLEGIPDLIATENGALVPEEIKSHKRVLLSDRLELAFYWRLLEPLRIGSPDPKGYLRLTTGERIEVLLNRKDFRKLETTIADIRLIREEGSELAIVPECKLCAFKEEHLESVRAKGGLSQIIDIGWKRQERLKGLGFVNTGDLARADIVDLCNRWRAGDQYAPSLDLLRRMQSHARAFLTDGPIYVGDGAFTFVEKALLLDLEYDSGRCIFLIGAAVLEHGALGTPYQFFAERETDERQILEKFSELVCGMPEYWILTWSGLSADLPQLSGAWARHNLHADVLNLLRQRHIDLYQVAYSNVRLPIEGFGSSDVAAYFGYRRKHQSLSGFDMPFLYRRFLIEQNASEKSSMREQILTHNGDDLKALSLVLGQLQNIVQENTRSKYNLGATEDDHNRA